MKIVYTAEFPESTLVFRYPTIDDAQAMCDYINGLSTEQTFIRFQGEQVKLEDETRFLTKILQAIADNRAVQLLATLNDKLVGISGVDLHDKTEGHEGAFGISLASSVRGKGIGKLLMKFVLDEAEKNITDLEVITFEVFAKNTVAISMYEKFGFKEYGRLPKGLKTKSGYDDRVSMYREVKR